MSKSIGSGVQISSAVCSGHKATLLALFATLAACGGGGGGDSPPPAPTDTVYTLSGSINPVPGIGMDSDVNDPTAPYRENDRAESAQRLPSPVQLNGYANVPQEGSAGRSQASGDRLDHYQVDLESGATVTLFVAEPSAGDLDLELLDAAGVLVDGSYGTGESEQVQALAAGTYVVRLSVFQGAANYVLNVGTDAPLSIPGALRLVDDFMPGDLIARYKSGNRAHALGSVRSLSVDGRAVSLSLAASVPGAEQLLTIQDTRRQSQALGDEHDEAAMRVEKRRTLLAIKALRSDPAIASAGPNFVRRLKPLQQPSLMTAAGVEALVTSNDPQLGQQWHYPLINLPGAWDVTRGDSGVIVAVIDTGVLLGHPDLQGQLTDGYDFISLPSNALDGDGWDANPDDPGDDYPNSIFHGTHVAGTIAAATNNGQGVAGVAGGVRVMPLRVLGAMGGYSFDIMQAVRYAAGLPNAAGVLPVRPAAVINLSLGGGGWSVEEQEVYAEARRQGVVVVAAAGNDDSMVPSYPASYPGVLSVSAVGPDKARASYSNFGPGIDLAAPGGAATDTNGDFRDDTATDNVWSTAGSDAAGYVQFTYIGICGTSMAAPHVAGVIALMKSVNRSLTPDRIDQLLASGELTEDIGAPGRDSDFGYGLIDAARAVAAAQGGTTAVPTILANPSSLDFGPFESVRGLILSDAGSGARVTSVTADQPWIQISTSAVDRGLGAYQVRVTRTGMAPGSQRATISVYSDAGVLRVPVSLQVTDGDVVAEGIQYAALLREDGVAVQVVTVRPVRGTYQYQFAGVANGRYRIAAGTDLNYDGRLCDAGEACGHYGGQVPVILDVRRNESGLDIDAAFVTSQGSGLGARGPVPASEPTT